MLRLFFDLAFAAKKAGEYELANLVFILVCLGYPDGVRYSWETQNQDGSELDEADYDLAVLEFDGQRLSMPVALLRSQLACTLLKRAEVSERRGHRNNAVVPGPGVVEKLWKELLALATLEEVEDAILYLDPEATDIPAIRERLEAVSR